MLKIGQLSKVCNVSVQTLRYYDKIGILCPDYIEEASGYRYYSPEKVKTFQQIEQLKEIGFSLDEIKVFINVSYNEQCRMYKIKKDAVLESIRKMEEQIKQIDNLCENGKQGVVLNQSRLFNISFEDDPEVIGKWEYCGNMNPSESFNGTEHLYKQDALVKNLFFLPDGVHIWMYFWTKGTLYFRLHECNVIVPNKYRIFRYKNETYMKIDWTVGSFVDELNEETVLIYRQVDNHEYTVRETYQFRDNINLPYTSDIQALGEWETVDVIKQLSDFTSKPNKSNKASFWILGLKFYNRGICYKSFKQNGKISELVMRYSAGVLIDPYQEHTEHYQILRENDEDFLIMEHKSGDYSYTGKVFCYYVFRRVKK